MNERFEKLAIQAAGKGYDTFATSDFDSQAKIQKFAELIVRECLMKVYGARIRNESYTELIERIEEDFGVEL